jgi:hypothetical protein
MSNALYTKLPNAGRSACPPSRAQNTRWLICRTTLGRLTHGSSQTIFSVSARMPR